MTHEHWFSDNSGNTGGVIAVVGYDGKCKIPEGKQRCFEWATRLLLQCQLKKCIVFQIRRCMFLYPVPCVLRFDA